MPFNQDIQSGELFARRGRTDPGTLWKSTRRNYAPDNRKIPPGPLLQPEVDLALDADPDAQLAANGTRIGAEQNTLFHADGSTVGGIIVQFTTPEWWGPASGYDVYAADQDDLDPACFIRLGRIVAAEADKGHSYHVYHPFLITGRTYIVALVPVNSDGSGITANDAPQVTVTLDAVGDVPPDVAAFDVTADCCELVGTWTPVATDRKDVSHYEVRQGATFDTGVLVLRVWGSGVGRFSISREAVPDPAFTPPNDEFHIKAVTGLGAVSAAEGSHTLTAIEIGCLTAACCVKGREITPAVGLDFLVLTSLTPSSVQPIINTGHGAIGGGAPGPGVPFYVDPGSFVPNGALFDYTIRFGMTTLGNESFPLTESTPR